MASPGALRILAVSGGYSLAVSRANLFLRECGSLFNRAVSRTRFHGTLPLLCRSSITGYLEPVSLACGLCFTTVVALPVHAPEQRGSLPEDARERTTEVRVVPDFAARPRSLSLHFILRLFPAIRRGQLL